MSSRPPAPRQTRRGRQYCNVGITTCRVLFTFPILLALGNATSPLAALQEQEEEVDPVAVLVERLTLDEYKATLKGLTQFGDRRQGTQRNRDAVDWIEAWLQDAGCTNTERVHYEYAPVRFADPPRRPPAQAQGAAQPSPHPASRSRT